MLTRLSRLPWQGLKGSRVGQAKGSLYCWRGSHLFCNGNRKAFTLDNLRTSWGSSLRRWWKRIFQCKKRRTPTYDKELSAFCTSIMFTPLVLWLKDPGLVSGKLQVVPPRTPCMNVHVQVVEQVPLTAYWWLSGSWGWWWTPLSASALLASYSQSFPKDKPKKSFVHLRIQDRVIWRPRKPTYRFLSK